MVTNAELSSAHQLLVLRKARLGSHRCDPGAKRNRGRRGRGRGRDLPEVPWLGVGWGAERPGAEPAQPVGATALQTCCSDQASGCPCAANPVPATLYPTRWHREEPHTHLQGTREPSPEGGQGRPWAAPPSGMGPVGGGLAASVHRAACACSVWAQGDAGRQVRAHQHPGPPGHCRPLAPGVDEGGWVGGGLPAESRQSCRLATANRRPSRAG